MKGDSVNTIKVLYVVSPYIKRDTKNMKRESDDFSISAWVRGDKVDVFSKKLKVVARNIAGRNVLRFPIESREML